MYLSNDIKKELIKQILNTVKPQKLIIFGSYAKGTANEDSDIDILIIEKEVVSKLSEKKKIRNALKNVKIPKDILVISEQEFDFYKNEFGSVIREAYEQGEIIWSI